jgi:Fe-S oxidoreductase
MHHTQFIDWLQQNKKIPALRNDMKVMYHDPCELGRGMNVYDEPRQVIERTAHLIPAAYDKSKALCCGGSLGNTYINIETKHSIAADALQQMNAQSADYLITSCPLCKKTFAAVSPVTVKDIAELVADNLNQLTVSQKSKQQSAAIIENG